MTFYLERDIKHIKNDLKTGKAPTLRVWLFVLFLSLPLLLSTHSFAEHEANHRFLVSGYVRDSAGKALGNSSVELEHKGGEKKKVSTNRDGYYEARLHLHDENLGDTIIVVASGVTKKIKVEFDLGDEISFRGASLDFGAPSSDDAPIWVFLTIASLVVFIGSVYFFLVKAKKNKKAADKLKQKKKKRKK